MTAMTSQVTAVDDELDVSTDQWIGERVHQVMWRAKIKQTQVAPLMGLSQSALSRKILGKRSWSIDELAQISTILGVPIVDLVPPKLAALLRSTTAGPTPQ